MELEFLYEVSRDIETFQRSLKGFSSSLTGTFLSMLTITTFGNGDIVPLTNRARILVGIESITGIVMIRWFATVLLNKIEKIKSEKNQRFYS